MEVTAALESEEAAPDFGVFFEANVDRARRLAWRLVGGDEAAAEDVVQDALVKLVTLNHPPDRIVPWLYRVVRNGAINTARTARRQRRHESETPPASEGSAVRAGGPVARTRDGHPRKRAVAR